MPDTISRESRNTPACAGTTPVDATPTRVLPEHPRVRGDDIPNGRWPVSVPGTPPRARGRRRPVTLHAGHLGNTPACAGTTQPCSSSTTRTREHPRVRGDDRAITDERYFPFGTPPRARGRRMVPSPPGRGTAEHPRVRGDDTERDADERKLEGTPPRARGRPATRTENLVLARNTPACAGTTGTGMGC